MNNIIFNDNNNNTIGYYRDLKHYLIAQSKEFLDSGDYEQAKDMTDLLLELDSFTDSDNLLTISDCNGMGYIIKEYENGD